MAPIHDPPDDTANQDLQRDGTARKGGAFLGYGSLEALAEALRPQPIPDEVGAEEWEEIARRIDAGEKPEITDSEPPPSSIPPPSHEHGPQLDTADEPPRSEVRGRGQPWPPPRGAA